MTNEDDSSSATEVTTDKVPLDSPEPDEVLSLSHNPLIKDETADTLSSVRNALCCLQALADSPSFLMSDRALNGFQVLAACLIEALNFELYCRLSEQHHE